MESIEWRPISEVRPYEGNPRRNEKAVEKVAASIREFGWQQPIVVDEDGVILAGHTRRQAAESLEQETVPVVVAEGLTDAQRRAYRLADNRLGELATWDEDLLRVEIGDLAAVSASDLLATGFSAADVRRMNRGQVRQGKTDPDKIPAPRQRSRVHPGDRWVLGDHDLICGDARVEMSSITADAVVTDPPYGLGFSYRSHDDSRDKWFDLMESVVPAMRAAAQFVVMPCCGIDRMGWWYAHYSPDWLVVWYKGSPGHRSPIGFNDYELLLTWGSPPSQMHDYFQTRCGFESADHPCPKPVDWGLWLVDRSSNEGGLVCDPFAGSGTTLIACEQLGRRCVAIEVDPVYCDIVIRRWEQFTGKKATKHGGGKKAEANAA